MNKSLVFFCVFIGFVFVVGCIGEEKTTKSSINSQSPEYLINPINLVNGYHSSNYKTYATSKMNSFDGQIETVWGSVGGVPETEPYEGSIPTGKKRIFTSFALGNDDNSVIMNIVIFEFDSGLYKESLSRHTKNMSIYYKQTPEAVFETGFIGDDSLLMGGGTGGSSKITIAFSYNKYGINIIADCSIEDSEFCKTESLKVAKAIKSSLD